MKTFAFELKQGDALAPGQTFKVSEDSGLMMAGEWYELDSTHDVDYVVEAGLADTLVNVRQRGVGLLISLTIPSTRVVKTAA